jgi:hypothetical protein
VVFGAVDLWNFKRVIHTSARQMTQDFIAQSAKSWLRSKGVMGSIGAAVLGIALAYQTSGQVSPVESAELVGIVISAGIAAYGRFVAKRPVK